MSSRCLSGRYLWKCGAYAGFERKKSGELTLADEENPGIFISRTYDSGKKETQWDRLVLDFSPNMQTQVYVWIFENREEGAEAEEIEDIREQLAYLKERAQYVSGFGQMLLYGGERGRYAKLALEFMGEETEDAVFRGYEISFPKDSFAEYLPAIYRDNPQLDRFLAIQQSIYLELERQIDFLAKELDYEVCSNGQAVRLAEWMGWGELARQADDQTVRKLLSTGISLLNQKGTCGYYKELTEILTDRKAVMIEEPQKNQATVLVLGCPEEGKEKHLEWLRRNVPIGVRINFVILHKTDRLDGQYFLDVTSYLSEYESELAENGVDIDSLRLL